jgi:hypothetical protein
MPAEHCVRAILIVELSRAHRCAGVTALSQRVQTMLGLRGDYLRLFLQLSVMIAAR